jgi:hypothetical protein
VYRLHVINVSETAASLFHQRERPAGHRSGQRAHHRGSGGRGEVFSVQVRVPAESGKKGSNQIFFDVKSLADDKMAVHEKASFLQP